MSQSNGTYRPVRWYNSLIVRVIALCAVLVLCLLGSVYVLTGHYFQQIINEMEIQASAIADSVEIWLHEHPDTEVDFDVIPDDLKTLNQGVDLQWRLVNEGDGGEGLSPTVTEGGYAFIATQYIQWNDKRVQLKARFTVDTRTEVLRAFRNQYLMALSAGFFIALGLMIYLIARTLQPLRTLSDSCAKISEGNLQNVIVHGNSGEILALERTFNSMVESLREKEKVEANLRQAQRLTAIGNLAAGVAHDVRNPLNAIKLLSSHAIDSLSDHADSDRPIKHLKTIRNEVDRIENIVSEFLSLAKEDTLQLDPRPIDPLLHECFRLVKKEAEQRKVKLIQELRAGDTTLMLDAHRWTRAVLNVMLNALEACPEGGRVRVFSRVTDQSCEIEVRDDGPGMSPETLERAFDAYFTTKDTGTGLGLSITRGIVEEHGGSITLTSTEGQGCQVLITMPLKQTPATAPAPAP